MVLLFLISIALFHPYKISTHFCTVGLINALHKAKNTRKSHY